ncbi:MAG: hypothetical protein AAF806_21990 [Bacteroidota bacterium]
MKDLITLSICILLVFNCYCQILKDQTDCDCSLYLEESKKHYGCLSALYTSQKLVKRAAECYRQQGYIDTSIMIVQRYIGPVNENQIGIKGWIPLLVKYQFEKHGKEYLKDQLIKPKIEIDTSAASLYVEFMNMDDLLKVYQFNDVLYPSIKIFGRTYYIPSTQNYKDHDKQLLNKYLLGEIEYKELQSIFKERWEESEMYVTIENIVKVD